MSIDLAYLAEDLAFLADGHDQFYVLAHPDQFDHHTVTLARLIDELEAHMFEAEEIA